jgi:uncharacterized protein YbcI
LIDASSIRSDTDVVLGRQGNAGRADGSPVSGSKQAAISNLTVRLLSQYTGRGPTKARTFLNDDMVTIVLQDTLTKAEIRLVENDKGELVLSTRKTFQEIMGDELIAGVEQILQRKVIAFLSANHIKPDYAVESFILAPAEQRAPQIAEDDRATHGLLSPT